jgi:hypothetical protein
MRVRVACVVAAICSLIAQGAAQGADTGIAPRTDAKDYPVQGPAGSATIAAAIVPENQVSKMFSPEIARQYIVVEVAIYPQDGVPFGVHSSDFALRVGRRVGRADRPSDVVPWPERRDSFDRPVDATAHSGGVNENSNDPVYGRQHGLGTYPGAGASSPRDDLPPPPDPRFDPHFLSGKVERAALGEGNTKAAIAGYLYFAQFNKRKKSDEIELKYAKDDVTVNLLFPK